MDAFEERPNVYQDNHGRKMGPIGRQSNEKGLPKKN